MNEAISWKDLKKNSRIEAKWNRRKLSKLVAALHNKKIKLENMKEAKLVNLLRTKCCYCHLLFRFSKSNTYKWLESSHADTKISFFFQIVAAAVVRVLTYTEETMCWIKMTKYLETTLWMRHKPYKEYSNTVIFIFVKPITVTKILVDCLF